MGRSREREVKWVLVESWNEGGHTYHVVRLEFEDLASDILDVIKELPLGAKIWETLQYGDTVEIVFRTVATIAAVA